MPRRILQRMRESLAGTWRALPGLWREPLPQLPDAAAGLQLPLHPSRVVRMGGWVLLAVQGLYLAQLIYLGHLVVATPVAVIGVTFAWRLRAGSSAAQTARRLLLAADGRLHLLEVGGGLQPAALHPGSMRLGAWLLLVLSTGTGTHRLLLGPDNLDPDKLAALRRRVAGIPQRLGGTR